MGYFDFSDTFTDLYDEKKYTGVNFKIPNFNKYKEYFKEYEITAKTEFRPDIIAYDLYENGKLSWVIDEINGISDYKLYENGKIILYLPYSILDLIGV